MNPTAYNASLKPLRFATPGGITFTRFTGQGDQTEKVVLVPKENGFIAYDANGNLVTLTDAEMQAATGPMLKSASFTAAVNQAYRTTDDLTVTLPGSDTEGDYIEVLVLGGTTTINGTGYGEGATVRAQYVGGGWEVTAQYATGPVIAAGATAEEARGVIGAAAENIVIRTSDYCVSDSILTLTTPTVGSDQTAALQALLDLALSTPLTLIWDGAYAVTGLRIHSNTTIRAHKNCGAILRNNSHASGQSLFWNNGRSLTTKSDTRIVIDGGIWHGNRAGQSVIKDTTFGWHTILAFAGVTDLRVENATFYSPSTFCSMVANAEDVTYQNNLVRVGNAAINLDGFKFNFGTRYRVLNNDVSTHDDAVSFCSNEARQDGVDPALWGALGDPIGPITDGLVDGLQLADSNFGVRVLSSTERVDRITIRNISGITRKQVVIVDNYSEQPLFMRPVGLGDFGSIFIENVNVRVVESGYKSCYIFIGGTGENLTLKNIRRGDFTSISGNFVTFKIDGTNGGNNFGETNWRTITISDYEAIDTMNRQATDHISVRGTIQLLRVLDPRVYVAGVASGNLIRVESDGVIRHLYRSGVIANAVTSVLSNAGTIDTSTIAVADINTPNGSSWLISQRAHTENVADPGYLLFTPFTTFTTYSAKKLSTDNFGGNVRISATITTAGAGTETAGVFARGKNTLPWQTVQQCYGAVLTNGSVQLFRLSGGTGPTLVNRTVTLVPGTYLLRLNCNGSTITVQVQRASDNQWLNSSGAWQVAEATCATASDAGIPPAAGEWGVVSYSNSSSNKTYNSISASAAV
jgi:hypothetical protein